MVAEVHAIRRSADGGEVKEFTSFLSQADYRKVYGGIGEGNHYSSGMVFPGVLTGGEVAGHSYRTMMFTLGTTGPLTGGCTSLTRVVFAWRRCWFVAGSRFVSEPVAFLL